MCACMVVPDFPPVSFPSLVTPSPTNQPVHVEIGPESRAHHRPFLRRLQGQRPNSKPTEKERLTIEMSSCVYRVL